MTKLPTPRSLGFVITALVLITACVPATRPPVALPPRPPTAGAVSTGPVRSLLSLPPLPFEENRGQADPRAAFLARNGPMTAYYLPGGIVYQLADASSVPEIGRSDPRREGEAVGVDSRAPSDEQPSQAYRVVQELAGARMAAPEPLERAETQASTPSRHGRLSEIAAYHRLAYRDAWSGVDVLIDRKGPHGLETTYLVAPGADPGQIRLRWRGASGEIDGDGRLQLRTPLGMLTESRPVAWQERGGVRTPVHVAYAERDRLDGRPEEQEWEAGFTVGAYDRDLPLVIDPTLTYASFLGGSSFDEPRGVAVDGDGNAYVVGQTQSTQATFPDGDGFGSIPGFDQTITSNGGAFLVKVNPAGTGLVYATYIGGDAGAIAFAVAVDAAGSAYVAGNTSSTEATFPDGNGFGSIPGYDRTYNGGRGDAFLLKLNQAGTALLYASYLGGSGEEIAYGMAVDRSGNAFLTGTTNSSQATFPDGDGFGPVPGFDQTFNGGLDDTFVAKLDASGTSLLYATYIGGNHTDDAYRIAVDGGGSAYVVGETHSSQATFPDGDGFGPIPGLLQTFIGDSDHAFVVKLNPAGTGLAYATYIGGASIDGARDVAVDAAGNAYVAGNTDSDQSSFPDGDGFGSLPGFDRTFNGGGGDAFVAKLNPSGTGLLYATYIGGSGIDSGKAMAVDGAGNVYLAGDAQNSTQTTFPDGDGFGAIPGFDQTVNGGVADAFFVKLNAAGTDVTYATFLGGAGGDASYGVAVDGAGLAYIVGVTFSTEATFPGGSGFGSIPGFDQTFNGGQSDAFVVKLNPAAETPTATPTQTPVATVIPSQEPAVKQDNGDSDGRKKLGEEQRQQQQRTNRSNRDDEHTEGNVTRVDCVASPPTVTLANRDGEVTVVLHHAAQEVCGSIGIGAYIEVDGQKENERLYFADDVSISKR